MLVDEKELQAYLLRQPDRTAVRRNIARRRHAIRTQLLRSGSANHTIGASYRPPRLRVVTPREEALAA